MRTARRRCTRHRPLLESLETRQLLVSAWGTAPRLTRLDQLALLHPEIDGAGQTVAVIDTGIDYTHPSLGGAFGPGHKVVGGHDFFDDDEDPIDTDGHGTAVAGVIAADEFTSGGLTYRGIAPAARLVALRIASDTSSVPLSRIEAALQWIIANEATYDFTAINLSFGFGRFENDFANDAVSDELAQINRMGIAFVSSSGNAGTADGFGISFPAADPTAISVGSVSATDVISEFTQRSDNLDILAVGEEVRSTGLGGTFVTVNGTSFASPAVTGTIALIRQVDDDFTLGDVRSIVRAASPLNYDGDLESGPTSSLAYKRLDVLSTVSFALQRKAIDPDDAFRIGLAGNENDLAFDADGVLHFAWYDNDARTAKYATRSLDGNWSTPINLDNARPDVGTEFSMKLDSRGRPVVAYLDGPAGDLKLGRFDGERWQLQTLDDKGVTGLYPSLAVDPQDRLYVSYFRKTSSDLKVASFDGSGWVRETIDGDGDVGYSTQIALDPQQRPTIAYGDAGRKRLKLARRGRDGGWAIQVADASTDGAAYISIAFDTLGRPALSYYEVQPADLKFATVINGAWQATRVASKGATGLYTNLRLDDAGVPTILYWDKKANALMRSTAIDATHYRTTRIALHAGKYTMTARSPLNGRWNYATNIGDRLIFGEV